MERVFKQTVRQINLVYVTYGVNYDSSGTNDFVKAALCANLH